MQVACDAQVGWGYQVCAQPPVHITSAWVGICEYCCDMLQAEGSLNVQPVASIGGDQLENTTKLSLGMVPLPLDLFAPACLAPVQAAGLDSECVCGRWDGKAGGSAGNANSNSGGHGRAVGPASLVEGNLEAVAQHSNEQQAGLTFRADSRWIGMAQALGTGAEHEVVVGATQSGMLYALQAKI
jgi:hypothetical protein